MDGSRRGFLKIAGLAALGAAGTAAVERATAQEPATVEPVVAPLTARRWAMVVDLRKCTEQEDCDRCVVACHREHNVPQFTSAKDEVKWVWKDDFERAFPSFEHGPVPQRLRHAPTLLLCNHCDNPPCTRVCPTEATFKRASDGLVMMDWHRCIGCRYCVVACPYGSRSFNWRDPRPHIPEQTAGYPTRTRGVVEKCTFCEERLADGRLPACVEACPHGALSFGDLEDPTSSVRALLEEHFTIRRKPELGTQPEVYYIV